jgi:hypothetical protein
MHLVLSLLFLGEMMIFKIGTIDKPRYYNGKRDMAVDGLHEVIDHLKCPCQFITEASNLVKLGGQLLISTPNIENHISKAIFLLRGGYFLFDEASLSYGHISPMTEFQIKHICDSVGLNLTQVIRSVTYPIIYIHRNIIDTFLWSIIALVALPFSKNQSPCKIYNCCNEEMKHYEKSKGGRRSYRLYFQ